MAGGVCLSNINDAKTFATEGPDRGRNRDDCRIGVVACFRRIESGSFLETPSSHVKLGKDNVETRFNFILHVGGNHSMYDLLLHLGLLIC